MDHPRSRGEYLFAAYSKRVSQGSSPLSRGIRKRHEQDHGHSRIIPALAGNTQLVAAERLRWWDHPRSRGEYDRLGGGELRVAGSSPLSRGIRSRRGGASSHQGIIPALAGNTLAKEQIRAGPRDHPRSRGEYRLSVSVSAVSDGSSPLSRGILRWCSECGLRGRIIPALAGNTCGC